MSKKGGSSAPSPDPRLVEAQIRSMGIQDEQIRRMVDMQDRLQPLQEEQMRFGLDASRTAFDQSQADREWSLGRRGALTGLQDQLVTDAKSFNEGDRASALAAQAGADYRQAADRARTSTARGMARYGLSGGKFADASAQLELGRAAGEAGATNNARNAARNERYALTDRATNALAGYPAMGMQATGQGASAGMAGSGLVNQGIGAMNSSYMSAGNLAGQMGSNASNMWGQQANYYTQNQSNDTLGGTLGGIGGVLTGLYGSKGIFSDRRLKENINPVGKDEATGLTLYEFNFKSVPDKRYVGVMADEVMAVRPEAVHETMWGYFSVDYDALGLQMKEA